MVGVGDRVDVDRVVVRRGLVGKVDGGSGTSRRGRGVKGGEDSGVGPCETCGDAEDGERGRQEGGERGGDGGGREFREVDGECLAVLCNGVFYGGNGKHVMQGLDRGGAKSAADFAYGDVLGDLEYTEEGFRSPVGPNREAIE